MCGGGDRERELGVANAREKGGVGGSLGDGGTVHGVGNAREKGASEGGGFVTESSDMMRTNRVDIIIIQTRAVRNTT